MDLFDYMRENQKDDDSPLAKRMRPESLDEVIGQEHIIGKEKLLYRLRTAGNRKNDACHGDRTYDKGGFQADQCNNLR